jgi:hypothetical protein
MLPHPSSAKDTSHSRLARPRRRSGSVRQRDTEFLQKMLGDSLAVYADLQNLGPVVPTTDGGPVSVASSNMNRSGHVPVEEHRVDAAHDALPKHRPLSKQDGANADQNASLAPRRRPSFGGLLRNDTSRSHAHSGTGMSDERRNDLFETSIAYDTGIFQDADFMKGAGLTHVESQGSVTGMAVSPSDADIGSQQVDADPPACSREFDRRDATKEGEFGASVSAGAEDWLSLHAVDLIRRIQDWADELSARELQLTTRMSQQLQRERRFRALCETTAAQAEENARQGR